MIFNIKQTNTQTDFLNTFTEMQPTIVIGELVPMTTSKSISPKSQTTISTTAATLIKGQLISECSLDLLIFQKTNKKFDKFLPWNLKSGQIIIYAI